MSLDDINPFCSLSIILNILISYYYVYKSILLLATNFNKSVSTIVFLFINLHFIFNYLSSVYEAVYPTYLKRAGNYFESIFTLSFAYFLNPSTHSDNC